MNYAIWNNKGGVGKSFLTFVLATEYAKAHPKQQVCVIDMCPQANVSEILLGGNGKGHKNISSFLSSTDNRGRTTIGGYLDKRLSQPDSKTGNESHYAIAIKKDFAISNIPNNLLLVCGDPSLELQVQSINQIASVDLPEGRWGNVHHWIQDLIDGISSNYDNNVVYFIDCNPSFATYTAQAVLAAQRLIVPCTADGASARAIDNIGQLLYGVGVSQLYAKTNFCAKAKENHLEIPKIHLVLLNRYTTSSNAPSKAFEAMYKEVRNRVSTFTGKDILLNNDTERTCQEIPDAHAVAITSSELAIPISELTAKAYPLQHGQTQINQAPLERYQKAINKILPLLLQ